MKVKRTENSGGVVVQLGPKEQAILGGAVERASTPLSVFKLKQILVPLDFSDCSKKSLEYAVPFAMQFDAELTLLHVIQSYPIFAEMPSLSVQAFQEASKELDELRLGKAPEVSSKTVVREGSPHTEIVEAAKELGADLIILSTHGRTGLSHVLLGSTAEKVVRHAPCPVLVVRERGHEFLK